MEGINLVIVILRKGFRESIQIYVVYHDSMTGGFFTSVLRDSIWTLSVNV